MAQNEAGEVGRGQITERLLVLGNKIIFKARQENF